MRYPIESHIRNEQSHLRDALNKAHDQGFDLGIMMTIERLENIDDWDEIDTAFIPEIINFIKKSMGIKEDDYLLFKAR